MSDEQKGNPLSDEHDPYQASPAAGDPSRQSNDSSEPGKSLLEHRALPAVAVAVAVLVVMAAIFLGGGGSDDDGGGSDGDAASPGPTASQPVVDGTATTVAGSEPASANPCPGFSYGANLLDEPSVAGDAGVHIWQDIYGFHIRLVPGPGSVDKVAGTVAWEGAELVLDPQDPSGASVVDGRIAFELAAEGNEVNFRAGCATTSMTVDLKTGDAPLDPAMITVGHGQDPITDNPVVLVRGG